MLKAALLYPDLRFYIEDVKEPEPEAEEVVVKVDYTGICGTDLHIVKGFFSDWVKKPAILGHEFSGTVYKVGKNVKSLQVGDKVVGEPIIPCFKCKACAEGRLNLCYGIRAIGFDLPGSFAEYVKLPSFKVYKVANNIPLTHAALTEPLAVALHAVNRGEVKTGSSVVVLGDGPIGLSIALLVRKIASKVILVGKHTGRLKVAEEVNVDATLNSSEVSITEGVRNLLGAQGADIVFEATGDPAMLQQAIEISAAGASIVVAGIFNAPSNLQPTPLLFKELKIVGSSVYLGEFPKVLDLMANGLLRPNLLISVIRPLAEIEDAFRLASKEKDKVVKVLLQP